MHNPKSIGDPRQPMNDAQDLGQGDLFDQPADETTTTPDEAGPSTEEAFLAFHHANPHVWAALKELALDWRREGKKKCGVALLYNVARWRLSLRTEGDGMFELNDLWQSWYARALMHFVPELDGMFETRRAPEADAWIARLKNEAA